MRGLSACLGAAALSAAHPAWAANDLQRFRAIYKELVETNTTLSSGDCTEASRKMEARLSAAGFPASDLHIYTVATHPKEGGLVAVLPGSDRRAKGVLLVAHIDVVEAAAADWSRPPFTLIEENGYFHGRGVSDNKANAAILVDTLIRLREEGHVPQRSIKIALTCGEETPTAFNGAQYLATQRRDLIDADIAFVPSGGGALDGQGRHVSMNLQAGEKVQQNFRLEARGTGSHGSRPTPDNALYHLADALQGLSRLEFPVRLNPVTRAYFADQAAHVPADQAAAIRSLLSRPDDAAAARTLSVNPAFNAMLRTTCVATVLETSGSTNTIPASARANVNCRLVPGDTVEAVQAALQQAAGSAKVAVTALPPVSVTPPSPPIGPAVRGPIDAVARQLWPGVRINATMLTGATDARHFNAVGIAAYGVTTLFNDPDGNGVHAANERIRVRSVLDGRRFVHDWVRRLGSEWGSAKLSN
jgi:acetylornithine deacetylase/succinyl-diaminopimelate desuccinylase-like protein